MSEHSEHSEHNCLDHLRKELGVRTTLVEGEPQPYFLLKCEKCGKEFHEVYARQGIWDPEQEEFVKVY